jgi:hypothetical protein
MLAKYPIAEIASVFADPARVAPLMNYWTAAAGPPENWREMRLFRRKPRQHARRRAKCVISTVSQFCPFAFR